MPNTPYVSTATRKADTLEDSAAKIMRAALGKDSQFSRVADESKTVPMPVKYGEPQSGDKSSYLKGLKEKSTRIGQYGTSIPNANDSRQTRIGQYGTSIPNANEAKPTTMPIQQLPKGYPIGGGAVAGPKAVAAGPIDKPIAPASSDNASFLKGLVNSADKVLTGVSPAYGLAKEAGARLQNIPTQGLVNSADRALGVSPIYGLAKKAGEGLANIPTQGLVNSADKVLQTVSPAYGVAKTMYEDYKKKPNK